MDQQLLDALNNMSVALEQIADALEDKTFNRPTSDALQSGDFSQTLTKISEGIDQIKEDNKKILDNQETIIKLQKQQPTSESKMFEESGEKKSMLKDGISVIILIAGAVLAIGMAFKLIGQVDFFSVLALSMSLPLIAIAFERIAKMKDLTFSNMLSIFGITTTMALAITTSSYILQGIVPVGPLKMITAILISGMFAVISMSMQKLMMGAALYDKANISPFAIFSMFAAIGAGITTASWIMNLIVPISISQGLTAILIAGTFAVISMNMAKLMAGVAIYDKFKVNANKVFIALGAIAAGITAASWVMNLINPISIAQGLTAILIAGTFALISINIEKLMIGVTAFQRFKVSPISLFTTLTSIAIAITASSWIMNAIMPISFTQALTSILIAGIFAGLSYFFEEIAVGIVVIDKLIGIGKLFMIPLFFTAIAAAITASSWIMSTIIPLSISQVLTVLAIGLSLAVITPLLGASMVLLGKIGTLKDYLIGGLAVVLISTTITTASQILSFGDYSNFPSLEWAGGVGVSLLLFGISTLALGVLITATGGAAAIAMGAGILAVISLAGTISIVSHILNSGNYGNYPSMEWVTGVGNSMVEFGKFVLGAALLAPFLTLGSMVMTAMATSIFLISHILNSADYGNYPSMEWVTGVGNSMVEFGKFVLGASLLAPFLVIGSMVMTVMATSIFLISQTLSRGAYDKYPSKDWIDGVGETLFGFAKYVGMFGVLGVFGLPIILLGSGTLILLAKTISTIGNLLNQGEFTKFPSTAWNKGVTSTIQSYMELVDDFGFVASAWGSVKEFAASLVGGGIIGAVDMIVEIDKKFTKGNFMNYPGANYMANVQNAIMGLVKTSKLLEGQDLENIEKVDFSKSQNGLVEMADQFDRLSMSIGKFSNSVESINLEKINAIRSLSSSVVLLSMMDPDQFESMMQKIESKSGVFSQLTNDMEEKTRNFKSVAVASNQTQDNRSNELLSEKLDAMTAILADISTVVGSKGTLKNYLMSIRENQIDSNVRSDMRTKKIIRKIGVERGINIYHFTYNFDPNTIYQGVIAQELIGTQFEDCLKLDKNGLYSVNYNKLGIDFKKVNN